MSRANKLLKIMEVVRVINGARVSESPRRLQRMMDEMQLNGRTDIIELRVLADCDTGEFWVWEAKYGIHDDFAPQIPVDTTHCAHWYANKIDPSIPWIVQNWELDSITNTDQEKHIALQFYDFDITKLPKYNQARENVLRLFNQ